MPHVASDDTRSSGPKQRYIWDGSGPFSRREGNQRIVYSRGDFVDLTPLAAYHVRGSIKTEGGLIIPAEMFDGDIHPTVNEKPPSYPNGKKVVVRNRTVDEIDDDSGKVILDDSGEVTTEVGADSKRTAKGTR